MIDNTIHDLVRVRNALELRLCDPSLDAKERARIEQRVASIRADIAEEQAAIGGARGR